MKYLCTLIMLLLIVLFAAQACFIEDYFPWCPSIDTVFAKGYSEEKFDRITQGMTEDNVITILGEPLSIQRISNQNSRYIYSRDGACAWLGCDFAWLGRSICFTNGVVIGIEKHVFKD